MGNPFKVKPHGPYERGTTLGLYREWLEERIAAKDPAVCRALNEIWVRAKRGEEVLLMCFCAPKPCHGDVVRDVVMAHS